MQTATPPSGPSIWAAWGSPLAELTIFIGIPVLFFVCMQLYRIKKSRHRSPVRMRKRACPICGLNSLSKVNPASHFLVVAWYNCGSCKQDFWRYRWNSLLRRRGAI